MAVPFDDSSDVPSAVPAASRRISARLTYVLALLLVTALSLLYLGQTSRLAGTSYDVIALQNEKRLWEMRNEQLRLQIAELESLDRVDRLASSRLGMGPPARVVYVNAPPVAVVVVTPTPTATPAARIGTAEWLRSLVGRVRDGLAGGIRGP